MHIEIQRLPNGWYVCKVRHATPEISTDSWHASPLEAYRHIMSYDDPETKINLPPGIKLDRLRQEALESEEP